MNEVVREFLIEGGEGLDQLDRDFVALEENPSDAQRLGSAFRVIHTIKGTCGFLAFHKLESLAHSGENLLSLLRDGKLVLDAQITTALLRMVDAIREMFAAIEKNGNEGDGDYAPLAATLAALARGERCEPPAPTASKPPAVPSAPGADAGGSADVRALLEAVGWEEADEQRHRAELQGRAVQRIGDILVGEGVVGPAEIEAALARQIGGDARPLGRILTDEGQAPVAEVARAAEIQKGQQEAAQAVGDSTIRVDVGLLDRLMNQVGELVLVRNQILQHAVGHEGGALNAASQRLNLITTELQEGVMKTRMQPIQNVWSKFPRVVRDLAQACGKQVTLVMEGKETELDKTLIEAIKDPLTHIVRNCVDHGLEPPEERRAAGKPAEGRVFMKAYHEGGQVNVEISDDGHGIDPQRVKKKAVEKGLLTHEQAARLGERELVNLIFLPGFSTAEKVTNVSGRGVGMDVVKTNIERIGGTVDIHSRPGQGTTLKIKIPLTLAIIPALMVTSGGDRYAIPQVSLLELVRLEGEAAQRGVEYVYGTPVYRLREKLLPLVYLNRELQVQPPPGAAADTVNIVVLRADDRDFGLVVDEINDTEEIVVKPLSQALKVLPVYAGATILGDGRVALILDVLGLAQRANVLAEAVEAAAVEQALRQAQAGERERLLVFSARDGSRMAIPLAVVARLEEFAPAAIERAGDQELVQYRGDLLPVVRVADLLSGRGLPAGGPPTETADPLPVVVCAHEGRSVGLAVDRILDIVDQDVRVGRQPSRGGVLRTVVIQERVTELVDVRAVMRAAEGGPSPGQAAAGGSA